MSTGAIQHVDEPHERLLVLAVVDGDPVLDGRIALDALDQEFVAPAVRRGVGVVEDAPSGLDLRRPDQHGQIAAEPPLEPERGEAFDEYTAEGRKKRAKREVAPKEEEEELSEFELQRRKNMQRNHELLMAMGLA